MVTAASFVKSLHISLIVFILLGWALPLEFLPAHIFTVPVVMIHWWTNKGQCILTQMENRLRGQKISQAQGQFVSGIFKAIGLRRPSDTQLIFVIYGVMLMSLLISCYRKGAFSIF